MKVDRALIHEQGGLRSGAKADALFVDSLETGDRIEALVMSGDGKSHIVMKTDNGQIVRARLGEGLNLLPGVKILLEVSGKEGEVISLSIIDNGEIPGYVQDYVDGKSGQAGTFADENLATLISKLEELNIPVNVETAHAMRELIERYPSMTLDEAAFLASNGLSGDEDLIRSALAYLSGGEKMDAIFARLFKLMDQPGQTNWGSLYVDDNDKQPFRKIENAASHSFIDMGSIDSYSPIEPTHQVGIARFPEAPLADWLVRVDGNTAHVDYAVERGNQRHEADIQKKNAGSLENTQGLDIEDERNTEKSNVAPDSGAIRQFITEGQREPTLPDAPASAPTGRMIVEFLSELPEFRDTPTPILRRFSEMLLRISEDNVETLSANDGNLAALLDKLFINIKRDDRDSGRRLKNAREELYARLALIEEEISRRAPLPKQAMLEQTRRLLDRARLFSNLDQFAYAQIPVIMGEMRKTAELYVFKRKDVKRVDPENVNVLLALELENMGHWEALINFRNRDVSIQMDVRAKEEKEYFSENSVLLHEMLAEAGFKLVNLDINHKMKETTPLTALISLNRYLSERKGMIDFAI
ncbi:MAG: flagellar hook-length control protein FliK [Oscillospiraceae bacterium]|nr:flagellar hook-length control protein FliK [Oscillospiraceae bacterium]